MTTNWFAWRDGSLVLRVRVHARSKLEAIEGLHGGRLRVRLTDPPVDDKANRALAALLARQFRVNTNRVDIVRGSANRDKTIIIASPAAIPTWFVDLGGKDGA